MTDPWCCYGNMDPINIPQMLAYIPYMDPMGKGINKHEEMGDVWSSIDVLSTTSRRLIWGIEDWAQNFPCPNIWAVWSKQFGECVPLNQPWSTSFLGFPFLIKTLSCSWKIPSFTPQSQDVGDETTDWLTNLTICSKPQKDRTEKLQIIISK